MSKTAVRPVDDVSLLSKRRRAKRLLSLLLWHRIVGNARRRRMRVQAPIGCLSDWILEGQVAGTCRPDKQSLLAQLMVCATTQGLSSVEASRGGRSCWSDKWFDETRHDASGVGGHPGFQLTSKPMMAEGEKGVRAQLTHMLCCRRRWVRDGGASGRALSRREERWSRRASITCCY